ncbi:MAG TPA: lysophospholipid acyltransferase family protein, partial [Pirellulales bacterium]|nr:lysophospholipid acyltransferase family protein [Pirellulales bacterium]
MAKRGLAKILWYEWLHLVCRLIAVGALRVRCRGRRNVPAKGGALVLANHQSHLDPVLVGMACDRRLNFLARQSLFKFAPLRWLIDSLDAIPIDR